MNPVYIFGDNIGSTQLIQHMGTDKTVVNAARVSFGQDTDSPLNDRDKKLIRFLISNKHTSPFEHCVITWKFVVPLFIRSQHHRHRTWSFNEISRRYTQDNMRFYIPKQGFKQHAANRQASDTTEVIPIHGKIMNSTLSACSYYVDLIKMGVSREQARMVLPQNLYTEYYGTVDLHNAIQFINLRNTPHAQREIRLIAQSMLYDLLGLFPITTDALIHHSAK